MYFSSNLKYLREQSGETQKDLADYLQLSAMAVSHYEIGDTEPNLNCLIKLASHYETTVDDLLRKDLRPPKPMYAVNLKFLRQKNELTQEGIGNLLKVNQATVANYEAGRRELSIEQLLLLADFFGVSLDQFVKHDLSEMEV